MKLISLLRRDIVVKVGLLNVTYFYPCLVFLLNFILLLLLLRSCTHFT